MAKKDRIRCGSCEKSVEKLVNFNDLKCCKDCISVAKRNSQKELSENCKICKAKSDIFFRFKSKICAKCSVKFSKFKKKRICGDCGSKTTSKWFIGHSGFQCQTCKNREKRLASHQKIQKERLDEPCLDCGVVVDRYKFKLNVSKCLDCFKKRPVKKRPRRNCIKCGRLRYVVWRSGHGHCCSKCRRIIDGKHISDNQKKNARSKTSLVVRYKYSIHYTKSKGYYFNLSEAEYVNLVSKPCYYCGQNPKEHGIGLDRIDNSKGYLKSNIVRSCGTCNKIRNTFLTVEEMKVAMDAVNKFRGRNDKVK